MPDTKWPSTSRMTAGETGPAGTPMSPSLNAGGEAGVSSGAGRRHPGGAGQVAPAASGPQLACVGAQAVGAHADPELRHDLALDLAHPLPGEPEAAADLVEGARLAVVEAVAHPDDRLLAVLQRGEHAAQVVVQQVRDHGGLGVGGLAVLDEVAERRLLLGPD